MLEELQKIIHTQKELMLEMAAEPCDDIHSVLRSKQLADSVIELEIKKGLLISLISKQR